VYRVFFGGAGTDYAATPLQLTMTAVDDTRRRTPRTTVIDHTVNATLTTDSPLHQREPAPRRRACTSRCCDNDSAGVIVQPSNGSTIVNVSDTSAARARTATAATDHAAHG
jgi:hypothetical protein